MQNRASENAVFGTRFLFDWKYAIFRIVLIWCWLLYKYKYMQAYKNLYKHFLWTIWWTVQNLCIFTGWTEECKQSLFFSIDNICV